MPPLRRLLASDDLLFDPVYRRLWSSVLASSFGTQITLLALPLTAAVLLHASPAEMGTLTAMETVPFALFSLPCGVWLDRVRKLRVYIAGELALAAAAASVPLLWWAGALSIVWLFAVAFIIGLVGTSAGSASQIVLTQVVPRDRLVEANARNALASSSAEVAGPGLAGALIRLVGGPVALLLDAALLCLSALILGDLHVDEALSTAPARFWSDLRGGLRFVRNSRILLTLGGYVAIWQLLYNCALVANILFATRILHMAGQAVGLSYVGMGAGTLLSSLLGGRISRRIGPGRCLALGFTACACGWAVVAAAPAGRIGIALFSLDLGLFGFGALLIFINFIALRQAVTPAPMLGRMTSTMRWLILLPAIPGALLGGWLGQHFGLRWPFVFAGLGGLLLSLRAWTSGMLRSITTLPEVQALEGEGPPSTPPGSGDPGPA